MLSGERESKIRLKPSADQFVTCFPIDLSAVFATVIDPARGIQGVTVTKNWISKNSPTMDFWTDQAEH